MTIHYHLIDASLRCPASELIVPANVDAVDLVGEGTPQKLMDRIANWLPANLQLERNGQALIPEVIAAEYTNAARQAEAYCTLHLHYKTDKPAEKLRLTSHFTHTIVSCAGVFFEMHSDKETMHEFDTQANLNNVFRNAEDFFFMGMNHLFTGPDHILFICTLIFALVEFKSIVKMLTGFTVGHSITLILSTFSIVHLPSRIADTGIALTIIYVGVENILRKEPSKNRWWLVTAFGLVHGLSFSTSLKEVGLPEQGLIFCLLSFNLGIEMAQVMIVAGVYPILSRLKWYKETLDEMNGAKQFRALMNVGSAMTACMGCYWLVERILDK